METDNQPRTHCIRCGTCCRTGSPTLQAEDIGKVTGEVIPLSSLYTLRRGEVVRDNIHGGLALLGTERIKIREREQPPFPTACSLYDFTNRACTIYQERPTQCAALECWDTTGFMELYERPMAVRRDLIEDKKTIALIEEHDAKCGYVELERIIKRIGVEGKKAISEIIDLIQYDHLVRQRAVHELDQPADGVDLIFGRPLTRTLDIFGLKVEKRQDGSLLLKRLE